MKALIKKVFRSTGLQVKKYPDLDIQRRAKIISYFEINKLLDVGANIGLYGLAVRHLRYKGKIISFEPLNDAFAKLKKASASDQNWAINNYALGDADSKSTINVAGNSKSSSILNMLPSHVKSAPKSEYISKQEITVKKLDTIFNEFYEAGDKIMLKIDTQGYEKNILDGAKSSLSKIRVIQLEMSIVPLYETELLLVDMITYLNKLGFELFSLEEGFTDPVTGRLLQVDGIFVNKNVL
jgi:FkbM family methyltransferase